MTCLEFQRVLPYIIETGGNPQEETHLKTCAVCSDLVQDLKYIAEQAKLLVPMEDPSPSVWQGIEKALEQEGLLRPTGPRGGLLGPIEISTIPWLAAAAALVLVIVGLTLFRSSNATETETATTTPQPVINPFNFQDVTEQDDLKLLAELESRSPELRSTYEDNLKRVNAYIYDAREHFKQDPDDYEAQQFLMQAYEQKAVLYRMALYRSTE